MLSPLRISVRPEDGPAYELYARLCRSDARIDVLLDGVVQEQVASADVAEGTIVRVLRDGRGRIVHDDGEILYETARGLVEIRVSRPSSATIEH